MKKSDIVPIEQARALAKPKPIKWRDFKKFVADVDELREYHSDLCKHRYGHAEYSITPADVEDEAEWCQKFVAKCKVGLERFDHRANYDDPDDDESALSHAHIAKRVTVMVASFPNANPGCPEGYLRMLIEHVAAVEGLSEPALESACREVVETKKFAPAISEVMEVIDEHLAKWRSRFHTIECAERDRLGLIEVLIKREQEKKKQEHEREVKRAIYEAQCAMQTTQRLAKEIEAVKIKLAALVQQHAAAEQGETECIGRLRKLTTPPEEAEAAAAAAKANGSGAKLL